MAKELGSEKEDVKWRMEWHWIGYVLLVILFFLLYRCFRVLFGSLLKLYRRSLACVNPKYRRRLALLKWIEKRTEQKINGFAELWENPAILGNVVDSVIPRAYDQDDVSQTSRYVALQQIQSLVSRYFDIRPMFLGEELKRPLDRKMENKFIRLLLVIKASIEKLEQTTKQEDPSEYVARGMGLITATRGQPACFFIYSRHELDFDSIQIRITGPGGETGEITITGTRDECNSSTCGILVSYEVVANAGSPQDGVNKCLRVVYLPKHIGEYRLDIMKHGYVILGSPFNITVENSNRRIVSSEMSKPETRVINRVVDFVNEKMLLTDKGELIKINCDVHSSSALTKLKTQIDEQSAVAISLAKILQKDAARPNRPTPEVFFEICEYIMKTCHFILQNSSSSKGLRLVTGANKFISGDSMLLDDGVITEVAHTEQEIKKLLEARALKTLSKDAMPMHDPSSDPDVAFIDNLLREENDTFHKTAECNRKFWLLSPNNDEVMAECLDDDVFCADGMKKSMSKKQTDNFLCPMIINRSQLNTPDIVYVNLLETEEHVNCRQDDVFVKSTQGFLDELRSSEKSVTKAREFFTENNETKDATKFNLELSNFNTFEDTVPINGLNSTVKTCRVSNREACFTKSTFIHAQTGNNVTQKSEIKTAQSSSKIILKKQKHVPDVECVRQIHQENLHHESGNKTKTDTGTEISKINEKTFLTTAEDKGNDEPLRVHISVRKIINDFEEMLHAQNAQVDSIIKTILDQPVEEQRKNMQKGIIVQNFAEENEKNNCHEGQIENSTQSPQSEELHSNIQPLEEENSCFGNLECNVNSLKESYSSEINNELHQNNAYRVEENFQTDLLQTIVAPFVCREQGDEQENTGIVQEEILQIGKTLVEALMKHPVQTDAVRNVIKRISLDKSLSVESVQMFLSSLDESNTESLPTTEPVCLEVRDEVSDSNNEGSFPHTTCLKQVCREENTNDAKKDIHDLFCREDESSSEDTKLNDFLNTEQVNIDLHFEHALTSRLGKEMPNNSIENLKDRSGSSDSETDNLASNFCRETSDVNKDSNTDRKNQINLPSSIIDSSFKCEKKRMESTETTNVNEDSLQKEKTEEKTFNINEQPSNARVVHSLPDFTQANDWESEIVNSPMNLNDYNSSNHHSVASGDTQQKPLLSTTLSSESIVEAATVILSENNKPIDVKLASRESVKQIFSPVEVSQTQAADKRENRASFEMKDACSGKDVPITTVNQDEDVESEKIHQDDILTETCLMQQGDAIDQNSPIFLKLDEIRNEGDTSVCIEEKQTIADSPGLRTECGLDTSDIALNQAMYKCITNRDFETDSINLTVDMKGKSSCVDLEEHSCLDSSDKSVSCFIITAKATDNDSEQSKSPVTNETTDQKHAEIQASWNANGSDSIGCLKEINLQLSDSPSECKKTTDPPATESAESSKTLKTEEAEVRFAESFDSRVPNEGALESSKNETSLDFERKTEPQHSKFTAELENVADKSDNVLGTPLPVDSDTSRKWSDLIADFAPNEFNETNRISNHKDDKESVIGDSILQLEADVKEFAKSQEMVADICIFGTQDSLNTNKNKNNLLRLHHYSQIPVNSDAQAPSDIGHQHDDNDSSFLPSFGDIDTLVFCIDDTKPLTEVYDSEVESSNGKSNFRDLQLNSTIFTDSQTNGHGSAFQVDTEEVDIFTEVKSQPGDLTPYANFNPIGKIKCKLCTNLPESSITFTDPHPSKSISHSKIRCKLCSNQSTTNFLSVSSTSFRDLKPAVKVVEDGSIRNRALVLKEQGSIQSNITDKIYQVDQDPTNFAKQPKYEGSAEIDNGNFIHNEEPSAELPPTLKGTEKINAEEVYHFKQTVQPLGDLQSRVGVVEDKSPRNEPLVVKHQGSTESNSTVNTDQEDQHPTNSAEHPKYEKRAEIDTGNFISNEAPSAELPPTLKGTEKMNSEEVYHEKQTVQPLGDLKPVVGVVEDESTRNQPSVVKYQGSTESNSTDNTDQVDQDPTNSAEHPKYEERAEIDTGNFIPNEEPSAELPPTLKGTEKINPEKVYHEKQTVQPLGDLKPVVGVVEDGSTRNQPSVVKHQGSTESNSTDNTDQVDQYPTNSAEQPKYEERAEIDTGNFIPNEESSAELPPTVKGTEKRNEEEVYHDEKNVQPLGDLKPVVGVVEDESPRNQPSVVKHQGSAESNRIYNTDQVDQDPTNSAEQPKYEERDEIDTGNFIPNEESSAELPPTLKATEKINAEEVYRVKQTVQPLVDLKSLVGVVEDESPRNEPLVVKHEGSTESNRIYNTDPVDQDPTNSAEQPKYEEGAKINAGNFIPNKDSSAELPHTLEDTEKINSEEVYHEKQTVQPLGDLKPRLGVVEDESPRNQPSVVKHRGSTESSSIDNTDQVDQDPTNSVEQPKYEERAGINAGNFIPNEESSAELPHTLKCTEKINSEEAFHDKKNVQPLGDSKPVVGVVEDESPRNEPLVVKHQGPTESNRIYNTDQVDQDPTNSAEQPKYEEGAEINAGNFIPNEDSSAELPHTLEDTEKINSEEVYHEKQTVQPLGDLKPGLGVVEDESPRNQPSVVKHQGSTESNRIYNTDQVDQDPTNSAEQPKYEEGAEINAGNFIPNLDSSAELPHTLEGTEKINSEEVYHEKQTVQPLGDLKPVVGVVEDESPRNEPLVVKHQRSTESNRIYNTDQVDQDPTNSVEQPKYEERAGINAGNFIPNEESSAELPHTLKCTEKINSEEAFHDNKTVHPLGDSKPVVGVVEDESPRNEPLVVKHQSSTESNSTDNTDQVDQDHTNSAEQPKYDERAGIVAGNFILNEESSAELPPTLKGTEKINAEEAFHDKKSVQPLGDDAFFPGVADSNSKKLTNEKNTPNCRIDAKEFEFAQGMTFEANNTEVLPDGQSLSSNSVLSKTEEQSVINTSQAVISSAESSNSSGDIKIRFSENKSTVVTLLKSYTVNERNLDIEATVSPTGYKNCSDKIHLQLNLVPDLTDHLCILAGNNSSSVHKHLCETEILSTDTNETGAQMDPLKDIKAEVVKVKVPKVQEKETEEKITIDNPTYKKCSLKMANFPESLNFEKKQYLQEYDENTNLEMKETVLELNDVAEDSLAVTDLVQSVQSETHPECNEAVNCLRDCSINSQLEMNQNNVNITSLKSNLNSSAGMQHTNSNINDKGITEDRNTTVDNDPLDDTDQDKELPNANEGLLPGSGPFICSVVQSERIIIPKPFSINSHSGTVTSTIEDDHPKLINRGNEEIFESMQELDITAPEPKLNDNKHELSDSYNSAATKIDDQQPREEFNSLSFDRNSNSEREEEKTGNNVTFNYSNTTNWPTAKETESNAGKLDSNIEILAENETSHELVVDELDSDESKLNLIIEGGIRHQNTIGGTRDETDGHREPSALDNLLTDSTDEIPHRESIQEHGITLDLDVTSGVVIGNELSKTECSSTTVGNKTIQIPPQDSASIKEHNCLRSSYNAVSDASPLDEVTTELTVGDQTKISFDFSLLGDELKTSQEVRTDPETGFNSFGENLNLEVSSIESEQDLFGTDLHQINSEAGGSKGNQMLISYDQSESCLLDAGSESFAQYQCDSLLNDSWLGIKSDKFLDRSQSSEAASESCSDSIQVSEELDFESIISAPNLDVALKKLEQKINSAQMIEHDGILEDFQSEAAVERYTASDSKGVPNINSEEFTTMGSNEPLFDWQTIKAMEPAEREIWGLSEAFACDLFGDKSGLSVPTYSLKMTRPNSPSMDTITEVHEEQEEGLPSSPGWEHRKYSVNELPIITLTPEQSVDEASQEPALTDENKLSPLDDSRFREDLKILSVLDYMNVNMGNEPTSNIENFGQCFNERKDSIPGTSPPPTDSVKRIKNSKEYNLSNDLTIVDVNQACEFGSENTSNVFTRLEDSVQSIEVLLSTNVHTISSDLNKNECDVKDRPWNVNDEKNNIEIRPPESRPQLQKQTFHAESKPREERETSDQTWINRECINTDKSEFTAVSSTESKNTVDVNNVTSGLRIKEIRRTFEPFENLVNLKERHNFLIKEIHNGNTRGIENQIKQISYIEDKDRQYCDKLGQRIKVENNEDGRTFDEPNEEDSCSCELLKKEIRITTTNNNIVKEEKEKINEHIAAHDRDTRISRSNLVAYWKIYWDNIVEENQNKRDPPTKSTGSKSSVKTEKNPIKLLEEDGSGEEDRIVRNEETKGLSEVDIIQLNIDERIRLFESMVAKIKLERSGFSTKIHDVTIIPSFDLSTDVSKTREGFTVNEREKLSETVFDIKKQSPQQSLECLDWQKKKCFQNKFLKLKEYFELLEQNTAMEKQKSSSREPTVRQTENTFSSSLLESKVGFQYKRRRRKRKSSRRQLEKGFIQSAPTSDSETPAQHTYQMWGSERLGPKVVERIHIKDLFEDVFNETDRTGLFRGGVPNRKAVLASLRSIDRVQDGMEESVPYDENGGENRELFVNLAESKNISNVPRSYQNVYPWIPTTPIHQYRSRPCAEHNLIPRNALLQVVDND